VSTIVLEIRGPVARLTLARPQVLNAADAAWVRDLNAAVSDLRRAEDVRVVVVTGAGRAFCTGVDLKALAAGAFHLADFVAWEDAMTALERMDALFVAGINGHCLGGGLQLALVCDYRLASASARLGLPAVKERLIPSMSLYRLPRLVGLARAQELILLGESITAHEAERIGLVNRVVSPDEFAGALEATVERFLQLPRTTVAASKRLTRQAFDLGFEEFRRRMEAEFAACLSAEEYREAMARLRPGAQRA
jgi:enoyl-CoA hydratase/carnithine racemase